MTYFLFCMIIDLNLKPPTQMNKSYCNNILHAIDKYSYLLQNRVTSWNVRNHLALIVKMMYMHTQKMVLE